MPSLKQARVIGGHQVIRQSAKELLVTTISFKDLGEFSVSDPQQCERLFVAKKNNSATQPEKSGF